MNTDSIDSHSYKDAIHIDGCFLSSIDKTGRYLQSDYLPNRAQTGIPVVQHFLITIIFSKADGYIFNTTSKEFKRMKLTKSHSVNDILIIDTSSFWIAQ